MHSIVSQGKVDAVLASKPEDRRASRRGGRGARQVQAAQASRRAQARAGRDPGRACPRRRGRGQEAPPAARAPGHGGRARGEARRRDRRAARPDRATRPRGGGRAPRRGRVTTRRGRDRAPERAGAAHRAPRGAAAGRGRALGRRRWPGGRARRAVSPPGCERAARATPRIGLGSRGSASRATSARPSRPPPTGATRPCSCSKTPRDRPRPPLATPRRLTARRPAGHVWHTHALPPTSAVSPSLARRQLAEVARRARAGRGGARRGHRRARRRERPSRRTRRSARAPRSPARVRRRPARGAPSRPRRGTRSSQSARGCRRSSSGSVRTSSQPLARAAATERDDIAERARSAHDRLQALERALAERAGIPPAASALAAAGETLALSALSVEPGAETGGRRRARLARLGRAGRQMRHAASSWSSRRVVTASAA